MKSPQNLLFSIGLLSDVQYADQASRGSCRYRDSLAHLESALELFNSRQLAAVVQLGDLVDSNEAAHLGAVLALLQRSRHPLIHVLGNHDSLGSLGGSELTERLGLRSRSGERLRHKGWRLVVIDSLEISVEASPQGSRELELAERELSELQEAGAPWGQFWNGRAGDSQMAALDTLLRDAARAGERVVLLNHMPAHPGSASERHLCWNHQELRALIAKHGSTVAAHFNGHDHAGGYAFDADSAAHYITLPALCDSTDGQSAHAIVHFFPDRLEIEGWGRVESRSLPL